MRVEERGLLEVTKPHETYKINIAIMKIKDIHIQHYKRFTDLTVTGIPATAKLIVLVGPNGCGKTSLFEAFNHWYRWRGFMRIGDKIYSIKKEDGVDDSIEGWFEKITHVEINFHDVTFTNREMIKGKFYFRSAYRNDPDFTINSFSRLDDPTCSLKNDLMSTDATVSSNYQRLVSSAVSGLFRGDNDAKTVLDLREELIGKMRESLKRVFGDLILTSVGNDPLNNGSFFFAKGVVENFHYKNLSAGEKSAFDLILDLIVKSSSFPNAVYCIDEPEAHMHTHLQSVLLKELYDLIPVDSQLWVSTHSLGMLRRAQALEEEHPGTVVFLDFDGRDFDTQVTITPTIINKAILHRFMQLALDDFSAFIAPQRIVFCEGNPKGHANPNFDAQVYTKIFGERHPETAFVSAGSCTEVENKENITIKSIVELLGGSEIIKIVDRDDLSGDEVAALLTRGIKSLSRRHIECYLFDDEVLNKLCVTNGHDDLIADCKAAKSKAIIDSVGRGHPADDVKSASGPITVELKRLLSLTRCGNNRESFILNTIVPLITPDMAVYQELEKSIFE